MSKFSIGRFQLGLLVLPALLGLAVQLYATAHGPAIAGDATVYLLSAKNLVEGNGLGIPGPDGNFRYLSHYPPFFPLVLTGLGFLGIDFIEAARYLNSFLFGMTILAFGAAFYFTTRCLYFSLVSQLLLLASPILIYQYVWAMSEPLSLVLGFASIFVLLVYFRYRNSALWLTSALMAGLSGLTRLISTAFVLVGGVLILIWGEGSWKGRISRAFAYMAAGSLPMLVWSLFDYMRTDSLASRRLGIDVFLEAPDVHFIHIYRSFVDVFGSWIVPTSWVTSPPYPPFLNWLLLLSVFLVFGFAASTALWMTRKQDPAGWRRDPVVMLLGSLLVFTGLYFLLSVFLYITVLPRIDLNNRMLLPIHGSMAGAVLLSGYLLVRTAKTWRWLSLTVYAVFIGMFAVYGVRSIRIVADLNDDGIGYLGRTWQDSETIQAVRELPADTILISNEEAALLFFTGHAVYPVMELYAMHPAEQMTSFGESTVDDIHRIFREEGAALILFQTVFEQLVDLYGNKTNQRVEALTRGLYPHFEGNDGWIYFHPERVFTPR